MGDIPNKCLIILYKKSDKKKEIIVSLTSHYLDFESGVSMQSVI